MKHHPAAGYVGGSKDFSGHETAPKRSRIALHDLPFLGLRLGGVSSRPI